MNGERGRSARLSKHYAARGPSDIRTAQLLYLSRSDCAEVECVNVAIGNVSLPMHPAMRKRLVELGAEGSPFADGVVRYTESNGTPEARRAVLNVIASAGVSVEELRCIVTDGGSQAMELMVLGVCGPGSRRPLMVLDPAYSNYRDIAARAGVATVSIDRPLNPAGRFEAPDLGVLRAAMDEHDPAGLVVIPADNPTGQFLSQEALVEIARLCVEHGMWLVSDEAYRQLHHTGGPPSTVWRLSEAEVPGIQGRRISIESASKVWNACGLRIGALATDSPEFHAKALNEYTANLCSNAIGQYIFGALAHLSAEELASWYDEQRRYYGELMQEVRDGLLTELPGGVVSRPEAALYSVVDVAGAVGADFNAGAFVRWAAESGRVDCNGKPHTLLVSPMDGFYDEDYPPARTRMRIAFVEPPEQMRKVPRLFAELLRGYAARNE